MHETKHPRPSSVLTSSLETKTASSHWIIRKDNTEMDNTEMFRIQPFKRWHSSRYFSTIQKIRLLVANLLHTEVSTAGLTNIWNNTNLHFHHPPDLCKEGKAEAAYKWFQPQMQPEEMSPAQSPRMWPPEDSAVSTGTWGWQSEHRRRARLWGCPGPSGESPPAWWPQDHLGHPCNQPPVLTSCTTP